MHSAYIYTVYSFRSPPDGPWHCRRSSRNGSRSSLFVIPCPSWLWLRDDQHLGCKACHLSSVKSCYGTGLLSTARQLSLDRLRKHAQSEVHLEAVVAVVSLTGCKITKAMLEKLRDSHDAPASEEFLTMLSYRRSGGSLRQTAHCKRKKAACLQYCLGEALRQQMRASLHTCVNLVTHADEKAKRMTLHFTAVDRDLRILKGTFGHAWRNAGHFNSVQSHVEVIEEVLRRFCTSSAAAPPPATKAVPEFDSVLFETLREKHSAFNTDACRVVILAGQEVVNHFGDNPDPLFPNAIAWIKDHTHAARRSPVFFRPIRIQRQRLSSWFK